MAFFHQFNKHQGAAGGGGGGSSSNNNATINWIANQNTQRELEADRVLRERQLAQGRIETEMQQFAGNAVNKRHVREQARVERDRAMEYSIIQAQTEKQQATEIRSQNERLAAELERVKLEKFRDEKMRQQVRETSYELRDLESKLRAAYVQKARTAQMAEKEALKFDSYLEDAEIVRRMRTETDKDEQDRRQREIIRQQEMIRYKQELERQLEERAVGKQKAYEEFLREKLVVDEIVRKIYEEDQRETERKFERQRATREFIVEFKRKREEWKVMERQRMEEENRRIKEYANTQQQREDVAKAEKRAREQALDNVQRTLADQIKRDREEREEQELVRQELYLEEQEQLVRRRERDEMEVRIKQRLELQRERDEQIQFKHLRDGEIKQEEDRFRQQLMAKFAEDDRIEQMNAQKRRIKQMEHKKAVDNLLEQRRRQMTVDKQREVDERIEGERVEQVRKQIIEEERIKLLREHAHRLLGYLPKGVIRDEKDLDYLGNDFKSEFKRRQVNMQHLGGWGN
ncbi:unnamed protein product [Rotaria magnacalcarata]|uniref:Meiosis-specific nuclear structural protein 1 n=2 Tax=Rotaria magnacalcarata TaxID=392030 RepID=A0A815B108_9BILA|nr:unnamed protein product [Rotaria magnacalcarata]CAF1263888.1 unnamed protein product [Rotaria magnacalcarata]CAF1916808.1 unnamed protein product [Rotaria magnacalcarata]